MMASRHVVAAGSGCAFVGKGYIQAVSSLPGIGGAQAQKVGVLAAAALVHHHYAFEEEGSLFANAHPVGVAAGNQPASVVHERGRFPYPAFNTKKKKALISQDFLDGSGDRIRTNDTPGMNRML